MTMPGGDADHLFLVAEAAMFVARQAGGDCHRQFTVSSGSV